MFSNLCLITKALVVFERPVTNFPDIVLEKMELLVYMIRHFYDDNAMPLYQCFSEYISSIHVQSIVNAMLRDKLRHHHCQDLILSSLIDHLIDISNQWLY